MRFLVDAQLPRRLARELTALGHDAIHTLDLPAGNTTSDQDICSNADRECRIVVTKDVDFRITHLLRRTPAQLLEVRLGNVRNDQLIAVMIDSLPALELAFSRCHHVELHAPAIVVHDDASES